MRRSDSGLLFSATDLMNYVGCPHATFLDLHGSPEEMADGEVDEEQELLKQKGLEHERRHLQSFIASGIPVKTIATDLPLHHQVETTLAAIHRGEAIIYQATLLRAPWHGYIDFLERVATPSALGSFGYEITDTKLAHSPKPKYLVQLCVYGYLLEAIQGSAPRALHLVLGTNERVSFRVADFIHYVELARERFMAYVACPPRASRPDPCNYCTQCRWSEHCQEEWELTDHLWLIANIQRSQIRKLNDVGVHTARALAGKPDTFTVPHIGPDTLVRLRSQARLQVQKKDTGKESVMCCRSRQQGVFVACRNPTPATFSSTWKATRTFRTGWNTCSVFPR